MPDETIEKIAVAQKPQRHAPGPVVGRPHHHEKPLHHEPIGSAHEAAAAQDRHETEGINRREERKANAALAVMGAGMAVSVVAGHFIPQQWWLSILSSGFEAGVVGGLADWFAVEALFRRIPIPGIGGHTDILRGKHKDVAERLSAMVQNEWLTAEAIDTQLADVRVSKSIESMLQGAEQMGHAADAIRRISRELLPSIDATALAADLAPALQNFVGQTDLAEVLAHGASKWLEVGGDAFVWDTAAEPLAAFLESPEFRATSAAFLEDAAQQWAPLLVAQIDSPFAIDSATKLLDQVLDQRSTWAAVGTLLRGVVESERWHILAEELLGQLPALLKGRQGEEISEWLEAEIANYLKERRGFKAWIAEKLVNEREIARDVVARLRDHTTAIAFDTAHPLRVRIRESVRGFAVRLERRDRNAIDACIEWRTKNVDTQTLRALADAAAGAARRGLEKALRKKSGPQWTSKVPWNEISGFLGVELSRVLREASASADHPARELVRSLSVSIAADLREGNSASREKTNALLSEMLAHIDLEKIAGSLLGVGLRSLQSELAEADGAGAVRIRGFIESVGNALRDNRPLAASFDDHARAFASKLINANRDMIGSTVRAKLLGGGGAKDADEFVNQIRKATIADLQRIRLNGAMLGFLIGLLLGALKVAL